MSVYVDDWFDYGKRIGRAGPFWSHLTADTVEELHAFAQGIGLRRAWFQNHKLKHYDIGSWPIRQLALAHGAKEVTGRELAALHRSLTGG